MARRDFALLGDEIMASEWKPEPFLRLVAGSSAAKSIPIPQGKVIVGRNKEACQIILEGDRRISKQHAEIRHDASGVFLQDLESTNHTYVNGEELRPLIERKLRDSDQITICEHMFVFHSTLVTLSDVDDESSKIIGLIDMASSSRLLPKNRSEERLLAILDISRDIGNTLHLRELLEKTLGSLFRIFPQADRGFILLRGDREPILQAVKQRDGSSRSLTVSTSVFAHVMDMGTAILTENLVARFPNSKSLEGSEIRTMMGVPLLDQDRTPIGMIQIDTFQAKSHFKQEDLDLLVAVAGPIGLAVENANLHEKIVHFTNIQASLQNAREVQLTLLPESRPVIADYEFWDIYEAAQSVGGDYFDYLPLRGTSEDAREWSINLGDVAGKGMPAALLMSRLASESRMCFLTETDPVRAMEKLNNQLTDSRFPERFITFIATVLNLNSHSLTIVNAGHMGAMIRRTTGEVEIVGEDRSGAPLAIFEGTRYRSTETNLNVGDVVVLYTDGVHEAMNPEDQCFRTDRLKKTVLTAPLGAENVGQEIIKAVRRHAAGCPQSDDIGIVCFRRIS